MRILLAAVMLMVSASVGVGMVSGVGEKPYQTVRDSMFISHMSVSEI
jgi:hypothetical protein